MAGRSPASPAAQGCGLAVAGAQAAARSPLNSAQQIRTPLLVVQGANDPRVNRAESDQIVVALRDRGLPVEYLVAPDEGHGFARPVNNLAMFAETESFLARHLGGRYQQGMTPEVARRLGEITVDPKTVVLQKRVAPVPAGPPPLAASLQPGTSAYKARIELGTQRLDLDTATHIEADGDTWVVVETARTPTGESTDRTVLDKATLVLRRRTVTQGGNTIDFDVKDGKATGRFSLNGQGKPLAVDLDGPLFADGAGAYQVMATLPLAERYATSFRNLSVQTQKVKIVDLRVVGSEQVVVPAGTFDTYKVQLSSADGLTTTTIWIAKAERKTVKISAVLKQMKGATLTAELQK